eukprot:CAMPEP_0116911446 /NCGR_PEP_ID=MMETSP0467-20121206/15491_1 /TAXON_ID=283647 /ORGANISM="Mesodinium pulex, Strain SPMC105" /LENGTH=140 /DNA_ID=CAMNT_0004587227 /DNA_START=501 /DNA_END=923 /DNA_ORIENTATION=+
MAITQLTMLQNSQLTNELDFQSGKADKSLNRNTQLQEKIYNSQRDIDIHKEVENELAKRAKNLFNVYQERRSKTKELEKEYNDLQLIQNERVNEEKIKELEENIFVVEENVDKQSQELAKYKEYRDSLTHEHSGISNKKK